MGSCHSDQDSSNATTSKRSCSLTPADEARIQSIAHEAITDGPAEFGILHVAKAVMRDGHAQRKPSVLPTSSPTRSPKQLRVPDHGRPSSEELCTLVLADRRTVDDVALGGPGTRLRVNESVEMLTVQATVATIRECKDIVDSCAAQLSPTAMDFKAREKLAVKTVRQGCEAAIKREVVQLLERHRDAILACHKSAGRQPDAAAVRPLLHVAPAALGDGRGDRYIFDEESGWFWSHEETLFYSPEERLFYDPESQQFFCPDEKKWFTQEELAEHRHNHDSHDNDTSVVITRNHYDRPSPPARKIEMEPTPSWMSTTDVMESATMSNAFASSVANSPEQRTLRTPAVSLLSHDTTAAKRQSMYQIPEISSSSSSSVSPSPAKTGRGTAAEQAEHGRNEPFSVHHQQQQQQHQQNNDGSSSRRDPSTVGLSEDWFHEPDMNLWFSHVVSLYYDEETGRYFDPANRAWHNNETDEWEPETED